MRPDHNPIDYDAIERDQQQDARRAAIAAKDAQDEWVWLMGSKRGRQMVWRLLDEAGAFKDPFHTNAMQMARNTGERAWVLKVSTALQLGCPDLWILMVQEHQDRPEAATR